MPVTSVCVPLPFQLPICPPPSSLWPSLGQNQIHLFLAEQHLLRPARDHLEAKMPAPEVTPDELPNDQGRGYNHVCQLRATVSHGNLIIALEWRKGEDWCGLGGEEQEATTLGLGHVYKPAGTHS